MSFGDFINLYTLYYQKYPNLNDMSKYLWPVRNLRNAAAHNNCLINSLKNPYSTGCIINPNLKVLNYVSKISGIGRETRKNKMRNPVIHDFVVSLYLFNKIVSSEDLRIYSMIELQDFVDKRLARHRDYFCGNGPISSSYDFLKKVVDHVYINGV